MTRRAERDLSWLDWVPGSGSMRRLAVVPVGAGAVRLLPSAGLLIQPYAAWLDPAHVLFTAAEPGHPPRIFVQDVTGDALPQPFSPEGIVMASADAVSPDRTRVAAIDRSERPVLLTNRGVVATEIPNTGNGEWPAAWDPDGGSIFVWHRVWLRRGSSACRSLPAHEGYGVC